MEAALCGCEGVKNTGQELCLYQRRFQQITGRMFGDMERACSTKRCQREFYAGDDPAPTGARCRCRRTRCAFLSARNFDRSLKAIIVSQQEGIRKMERLLCRL